MKTKTPQINKNFEEFTDFVGKNMVTKQEFGKASSEMVTKKEFKKAISEMVTKKEFNKAVSEMVTKKEFNNAVAEMATKKEVRELASGLSVLEKKMDHSYQTLRNEIMNGMDYIIKYIDEKRAEDAAQFQINQRHEGWIKGLAHHTKFTLKNN